jgi:hypothetical protein
MSPALLRAPTRPEQQEIVQKRGDHVKRARYRRRAEAQ